MDIYTKQDISKVVARLNNEEICILPTDTIYGISSLITTNNAREKINKIKKSPKAKDLIILVASIRQAHKLAELSKDDIFMLKKDYPTTVIAKLRDEYKNKNIVTGNTIAIRVIKNKFIKKVIKKTAPMYSTSANFSKNDYVEQLDEFKKLKVDFIVFGEHIGNTHSRIYNSISKKIVRV